MAKPLQPRRQPTLDEVARRAGVSRAAASRAVNNAPHVSPSTKAAIERAVRELGYVPNQSARALASNSTRTVLLAAADPNLSLFADPFFSEVILGASSVLEKTDLELSLALASTPQGRTRLERALTSPRADGIMLVALRAGDPLQRLVASARVPLVLIGRPAEGGAKSYVDADNYTGAKAAVAHLLAMGRRRIAIITGPLDMPAAASRLDGFRDALVLAGVDADLVTHADFTQAGGAEAMAQLLVQEPRLDGVFAASDNMAAGALETMASAGRRVPEDVAVVGFDDLPIAGFTRPTLTTVHQPVRALGQEAARLLLQLVAGEEPHPRILPTRLVVRESAP